MNIGFLSNRFVTEVHFDRHYMHTHDNYIIWMMVQLLYNQSALKETVVLETTHILEKNLHQLL